MRKNILLFSLLFLSCALKYTSTGKKEVLNREIQNVVYKISEVKRPSPGSPYLTLKITARDKEVNLIKEKYLAKKQISSWFILATIAGGIGGAFYLNTLGYAVLARDLAILAGGTALGVTGYNLTRKPHGYAWKKKKILRPKEFIPEGEKFKVELKGTGYYTVLTPDEQGYLTISLVEFAVFYEKGKDFQFVVYSPDGKKLGEYTVSTEPFSSYLAKAKTMKYPPQLSFTPYFDDSTRYADHDLVLDGDETGRIKLRVKNTGKGVAQDLEIRITQLTNIPYLEFPGTEKIEKIMPMQEVVKIIPIKAGRNVPTGEVKLKIEILEPYFQADADPQILRFRTKKFIPPNLVLYDKGVEEGEIVAGKSANISLVIKNEGGRAYDVKCKVGVPPGITYLGEKDMFNFGNMESGEWRRIDFPVFVGKRYAADSLRITLALQERRKEFSKNLTVAFPLNRPVRRIKEIIVRGEERQTGEAPPPPVLTVDVDVNVPETGKENPYAIAVIIGNRRYEEPSVPDVEYAENDVRTMREYLIKTLGFKPENIIEVIDAKKSDFERIFGTESNYKGQLYSWVKRNVSDVFVYYTGHGAPDPNTKKAYFVPVDCHPDYVELNGYPLDLFYRNLSKLPARSIVVVIDACFSGGSEKGMLIARASPLTVRVEESEIPQNINVFTSSRGDEISSWYPEKRHSLFTYFFLKGLQGYADKNRDGKITLGELADYTQDEVSYLAQRLFHRTQTPTFRGDRGRVIR